MITDLEHLKSAVLMLDQGGLTPGEELRILASIEHIAILNKNRIEHEVIDRVNEVLNKIKENWSFIRN